MPTAAAVAVAAGGVTVGARPARRSVAVNAESLHAPIELPEPVVMSSKSPFYSEVEFGNMTFGM